MTAETDLETRIERLEDVADRWDQPDNPGGRRIARRARDKADGMRAARRVIAQARREGAAEVEARVKVALAELYDTEKSDALRVSRAMIALGERGPELLAALERDRAAALRGDA